MLANNIKLSRFVWVGVVRELFVFLKAHMCCSGQVNLLRSEVEWFRLQAVIIIGARGSREATLQIRGEHKLF